MNEIYMGTSEFGLKVLVGPVKGSIAASIWEMTSESQERDVATAMEEFIVQLERIFSQKLPVA